jgi:GT2 family glycosyltransferase
MPFSGWYTGLCNAHECGRCCVSFLVSMSAIPPMSSGCQILAVAVLYRQSPRESAALSSFIDILKANPGMAGYFSLVIYDNSPEPHEAPDDFPLHYVHDPANGGLAAAYNYALSRAEMTGCEWLLLLDQDTTLTGEFFTELTACAMELQTAENVAAIVPKLIVRGTILSPAEHFIDYIRHQFRSPGQPFGQEAAGIQRGRMSAYNSGSTLRVKALRSFGGFPEEFWLDYLDHAVFHSVCTSGGQVYVMHAMLSHDLGGNELNTIPIWRFRSVLRSQALFVKRTGSLSDRLLYRLWLLRSIRRLRANCPDRRIWKETAQQALLFSGPNSAAAVRPPTNQYTAKGL